MRSLKGIVFSSSFFGSNIVQLTAMKKSLLILLLFVSFQSFGQVTYSQLLGKWKLVHFDGIAKIVNSPEFQNATEAQRESINARIKSRLENTIYEFLEGDTLEYVDFEQQSIVRKSAKVELQEGDMLLIHDEKGDRLARILSITEDKLILQPITKNSAMGNLTFERIFD